MTHYLFLDVGKEGEEFWKEGKEGGLPHHSKALVVVLGAADTALPEPLRERLELLELERLATDEIGDGSYLQQIQSMSNIKMSRGGSKLCEQTIAEMNSLKILERHLSR